MRHLRRQGGWACFFRSVRMCLMLYYSLLLGAMLLAVAVASHLIVRQNLREEIDKELKRGLGAVESVVRAGPEHLSFFDAHSVVDFFLVEKGDRLVYESKDWGNAGLSRGSGRPRPLSQWPWITPPKRSFWLRTREVQTRDGSFLVTVAEDTAPMERTLTALTTDFLLAVPLALALMAIGGFFMAGRVLTPVRIMADKADQITADRLSERLPVDNPGDEFGRLALAFNRVLERLEDSFSRLRRFTADASHELRTPLTAIRSVGEIGLSSPDGSPRCHHAISSMLEETERLGRLVEGLLILARGDAGAIHLEPESLPLMDFVEEVADMLRVLAEDKDQQLVVSGDKNLVVTADTATLRQALMNLIDNAIRHTPRGGRVDLVVHGSFAGAQIEVRDKGPGIAPEHKCRVFDRFYRIAGEALPIERRMGGCGLGLSIAKWAAEVNGAQIELESREGGGSIFRIVFPESSNR